MLAWGDWFGPAALAAGLLLAGRKTRWTRRDDERAASEARSEPKASGVGSWGAARFVPGQADGPLRELVPAREPPEPAARVLDPLHDLLSPRRGRADAVGRALGDRLRRRDPADHRGRSRSFRSRSAGSRARGSRCASGRPSSRAPASRERRPRAGIASPGSSPSAAASGRCCCSRESCTRGAFPPPRRWSPRRAPVFDGWLEIDGARIAIDGWRGSQNHNWGSRHTDRYAWGQVAGFDGAADAFLECSTARVRVGPLWTPWLTLVGAAHRRTRACAERPARLAARPRPHRRLPLELRQPGARACGSAAGSRRPPSSFVALRYGNPPGGEKICLNSKLARCELALEEAGRAPRSLRSEYRAAFEILTDEAPPEVPIAL